MSTLRIKETRTISTYVNVRGVEMEALVRAVDDILQRTLHPTGPSFVCLRTTGKITPTPIGCWRTAIGCISTENVCAKCPSGLRSLDSRSKWIPRTWARSPVGGRFTNCPVAKISNVFQARNLQPYDGFLQPMDIIEMGTQVRQQR